VLGKKDVVVQDYPYLLGTLPYRTEVRGGAYAMLPSSLRHKLSFTVVRDQSDTAPLTYTASLPELAGKKITLSYTPATQADEDVISSYLPVPHPDGTPIQPEELPSALPAYLIKVKPELRIDGEIVAAGSPVTLGGAETFTMSFFDPATGTSPVVNAIDAGTYHAVALDLGRIAEGQILKLKDKLENTKARLENQDFTGLTKDDLVGDLLYTTALLYHGEVGTVKHIAARTMGVGALTLPSEAIFATKLQIDLLWGMPRSVYARGLSMDADRMMNVVKSLDGNPEAPLNYMLSTGMASSALEHVVPEKLFSTSDAPGGGVSAVKALQIANALKVPIYNINLANADAILPLLKVDADTKANIEDAVNAGKVVTVSEQIISLNSWDGCGYIIVEPSTGAGAYMISGGLNGGWFDWERFSFDLGWGSILILSLLAAAFLPFALGLLFGWCLAFVGLGLNAYLKGAWGRDIRIDQKTGILLISDFIGQLAMCAVLPFLSILFFWAAIPFVLIIGLVIVGLSWVVNRYAIYFNREYGASLIIAGSKRCRIHIWHI
jgi:hypothetical protein